MLCHSTDVRLPSANQYSPSLEQIDLDPTKLPGYINYEDDITPSDLDILRDKVQKLKAMRVEKKKQEKVTITSIMSNLYSL